MTEHEIRVQIHSILDSHAEVLASIRSAHNLMHEAHVAHDAALVSAIEANRAALVLLNRMMRASANERARHQTLSVRRGPLDALRRGPSLVREHAQVPTQYQSIRARDSQARSRARHEDRSRGRLSADAHRDSERPLCRGQTPRPAGRGARAHRTRTNARRGRGGVRPEKVERRSE